MKRSRYSPYKTELWTLQALLRQRACLRTECTPRDTRVDPGRACGHLKRISDSDFHTIPVKNNGLVRNAKIKNSFIRLTVRNGSRVFIKYYSTIRVREEMLFIIKYIYT